MASFFLLLQILVTPAQAYTEKSCTLEFLKSLGALKKTAHYRGGEKLSAGTILARGETLPSHLPDGVYVFIGDAKGNFAYSPRVPNLMDVEDPLVTHRSLYQKLWTSYKKGNPKIVYAGEFHVSFGKVSQVNNHAGTFRGKIANLLLSKNELTARGLRIEKGTEVLDAAKKETRGMHTTELNEARLMYQYETDPELREAVHHLLDFYRRTESAYPSAIPGRPNFVKLYTATHRKIRPVEVAPAFSQRLTEMDDVVMNMFETTMDRREFYFQVDFMFQQYGREKMLEAIKDVEKFEGVYIR